MAVPATAPAAAPAAKTAPPETASAAAPAPKVTAGSAKAGRTLEGYEAVTKKQGSIRIEFRVTEQNSHIGHRNIHEIKAGSSRQIGGGRSDFLVFLVPMPRNIAELHFDGVECVFVPKSPELFPDLAGPVRDCLGKDIPFQSPRGYPLHLHFSLWEPPLESINRLLHCIEVPGLYL
jgi:hypothetical protein